MASSVLSCICSGRRMAYKAFSSSAVSLRRQCSGLRDGHREVPFSIDSCKLLVHENPQPADGKLGSDNIRAYCPRRGQNGLAVEGQAPHFGAIRKGRAPMPIRRISLFAAGLLAALCASAVPASAAEPYSPQDPYQGAPGNQGAPPPYPAAPPPGYQIAPAPYPAAPPPGPAVAEPYPYMYGAQRYCWYGSAWRGPGWYWCGYAWRQGYGWGGPLGWNGWRRGGYGWRGGYGGRHGHFEGDRR